MPWKSKEPCRYAQQICFSDIFFGDCYRTHSPANTAAMKKRWSDLKHSIRRKLQEQGYKQIERACKSGINCYYLLRGDCRQDHCSFDLKLAACIREELFKIDCPISDKGCSGTCFYHHEDERDEIFQQDLAKLKEKYQISVKRQNQIIVEKKQIKKLEKWNRKQEKKEIKNIEKIEKVEQMEGQTNLENIIKTIKQQLQHRNQ